MPKKCLLILLDGLGDRTHPELGGKTPLTAADTPTLDSLADQGANGLFHASFPGQPLPSEIAHMSLFGYPLSDFPGRGPLEGLGAGLDPGPEDVLVLAHLACLERRGPALYLRKDLVRDADPETIQTLVSEIAEFRAEETDIRFTRTKGLFGALTLSGRVSPMITDSNPMVEGRPLSEILPVKVPGQPDPKAGRAARALKKYLVHCHELLCRHPLNRERERKGLCPINGLVTQRAGRLKEITPFEERFGMKGGSISSGVIYQGLARYLGLEPHKVEDGDDPGRDMAERLALARKILETCDFVHVHTKAPDQAAHKKDPLLKKRVIESLDQGIGREIQSFLDDPRILVVVTSDHSTPSSGPLIHSGEPVPALIAGPGARRDDVAVFNEIAAARGSLGLVRGVELFHLIFDLMDRSKLAGIRDTPEDHPFWPGRCAPFTLGE